MVKECLRYFILYFCLFHVIACTCSINVTFHDEKKAAIVAENFFNTLVKDGNIGSAYAEAGQLLRENATKAQLAQLLEFVKDEGLSNSVKPVAYESFGSKEEINIYLVDEEIQTKLRYQIGIQGTMLKGYEVIGMFLINDEYKPSGDYKEF